MFVPIEQQQTTRYHVPISSSTAGYNFSIVPCGWIYWDIMWYDRIKYIYTRIHIYIYIYIYAQRLGSAQALQRFLCPIHEQMMLQITVIPMGKITQVLETYVYTWDRQVCPNDLDLSHADLNPKTMFKPPWFWNLPHVQTTPYESINDETGCNHCSKTP